MRCAWIAPIVCLHGLAWASLVTDVRTALANGDFSLARSEVESYRAQFGTTPEMLEGLSWLGRAALAGKNFGLAEAYALETRKLAEGLLKKRPLDAELHLPLALGAAIEIHANLLVAQGQRAEAVTFLQKELAQWRATSMRARIQKNIHLLSLEGKPAPLASLRGHPVLLFFWAHWCPDCKQEVLEIARLEAAYRAKGLVVIGPTQHYGYVAGGEEAGPPQELRYMEEIRREYYAPLADMPAPVSEENFKIYGASTTPTLVLIDGKGIVRMYHPGAISYAELAARLDVLTRR